MTEQPLHRPTVTSLALSITIVRVIPTRRAKRNRLSLRMRRKIRASRRRRLNQSVQSWRH